MHAPPYHVLFVCTGNSARSVLSEATLNVLGGRLFMAYSAGSHPTGRVNPFAIRQLQATGIPSSGYRSKSWDEFSGPDAPPLDIVVTVCDSAAAESCPAFFGDFITTHWGLEDPASVEGSDEVKMAAFAKAHRVIRHRIEQMIALPIQGMPEPALRQKLATIGRSLP